MKAFIIFLITFTNFIFAQIDTSVWYPMAKGNYWEYQDSGLYVKKGISVVGDTLMTNGKTYLIFRIKDLLGNGIQYSYRRVDSNSYLYIWRSNGEYKYYDLTKHISESWRIDSIYNRRLVKKDSVLSQLFGKKFPRLEFEDLYFTINNDTMYTERSWQQIYKGVGDVILGEHGGYVELVGAIINGKSYGTITSVRDEKNIPSSFVLLQNYPNPFNPTTTINYSVPKQSKVTILVYDALGREVAILVNEEKIPGNHEIKFDGRNLSSGIYFYQIITAEFIQTKKMLLLK